jgi:ribonuclease HII
MCRVPKTPIKAKLVLGYGGVVHSLLGVDEVGRGCWAGPLVAGAALLVQDVPGLKDSKKLTKKRRDILTAAIYESGAHIGLGWVWPAEIDSLGLTESVRLAMTRAIEQIEGEYEEIIIDGSYNFLSHLQHTAAIVKADDLIPAVSAASIVAKVARDTYMEQLEEKYHPWQFHKHVGYGTTLHSSVLKEFGVSDIHRRSYKPIKAYL